MKAQQYNTYKSSRTSSRTFSRTSSRTSSRKNSGTWQGIILGVLTLTSIVTLSACSDSDPLSESENYWDKAGNEVISLVPERYENLKNPMTGWNLYTGLGDGLIDNFWEAYDNFDSSKGKVKVSDYASCVYIRGAWSDFNPEEGVYVWDDNCNTKPAQRFKMLVKGAKERGLKLGFTFITNSEDKHYDFTPAYVKDKGAQGYNSVTGSATVWSPYADDPVFQQCYEKFLRDFAAVYNDPDITMYISGFGLGKWGESHTMTYSTGNTAPREATFHWIVDLMENIFDKVPIVINYHRCILDNKSMDGADTAKAQELLMYAYEHGFSFRHDAFGMKHYYLSWEQSFATLMAGKRPIIAEGGWVRSSHGNSPMNSDGYKDYADVRKGEYEMARAANANMLDFRYSSNLGTGETASWFSEAFDLVEGFITEGGYRLYPDKVSVPVSAKRGNISITHRWSNLGWGFCPTNLPQWNQKYKIAFALLDANTEAPLHVFVDEQPCLNTLVKDKPQTFNSSFNLSDVPSGLYTWAIGIVDTTKNNQIGLQTSVRSKYKTVQGWVKLTDVTVN